MKEKQTPFEQREMKKRSMFMEAMNRLLCNRSAVFGLVILLAMILLCAFAEIICPEGYNAQNIPDAFCQPFENYFLGTDNLGRSMLARILYGGRNSLLIGFAATLIAAITGVILGMLAAFYGGRVDNIIMRGMDVLNSIPNLLLAVLVSACLGNGTINTMIAVAVSTIAGFARTVRGPMLAIMGQEYIEAARSIDASDKRIMFKHILPNILSPIIVQFTMGTAISILCVSSLSFIGMGIQPPIPEWGGLLSAGRQYITRYPYLCIEPGIAIALVVFSMNLFGDGLRDALDPRLKK
ncbi:MAG: ABC transporter permease [Lachnospiraceae bacterium]|jgi:peptide/nickel transport system permease protein|nr:ABC transporter permease [Lachnospiraceae bacterium]MCI9682862.1 ABC transporter permease [Lachnospiraceae bacterium]